ALLIQNAPCTKTTPLPYTTLFRSHKVFTQMARDMNITNAPIAVTNVPQTWQYRTYVALFPVFVSRSNKALNKQTYEFFRAMVLEGAKHGWTEYRAAPAFQDLVASTYSFNNNILLRYQT